MRANPDTSWQTLSAGRRLWFMVLLVFMGGVWGLQFSMLKLATANGYGELTVLFVSLLLIALALIFRDSRNGKTAGD